MNFFHLLNKKLKKKVNFKINKKHLKRNKIEINKPNQFFPIQIKKQRKLPIKGIKKKSTNSKSKSSSILAKLRRTAPFASFFLYSSCFFFSRERWVLRSFVSLPQSLKIFQFYFSTIKNKNSQAIIIKQAFTNVYSQPFLDRD